MWGLFGAMVIAEIVIYKKYPRSMRLNFFDHRNCRNCLGHQTVNFRPILLIFCGQIPREPDMVIK